MQQKKQEKTTNLTGRNNLNVQMRSKDAQKNPGMKQLAKMC